MGDLRRWRLPYRTAPPTPTAREATMRLSCLTLSTLVVLGLRPGQAAAQDAPAWREIRYRESAQAFPNPERGFYAPRMSHRIGRLDGLRSAGSPCCWSRST